MQDKIRKKYTSNFAIIEEVKKGTHKLHKKAKGIKMEAIKSKINTFAHVLLVEFIL